MTEWTIRAGGAGDAETLASLHVQGWRDSYGGIVDADYLAGLDETELAQRWRGWFADGQTHVRIAFASDGQGGAGAPAGFVSFGRVKTPLPGQSPIRPLYSGEIYAIYILADYWRQGLGRLLMHEAAGGLAALKHKSLCLWVIEKNKRAVEFYKTLGGQRCGRKPIEIGRQRLEELAFGWRDAGGL